jgi:acetoin utilization protein AcuB
MFYVIVDGIISQIELSYIRGPHSKRLEPTLAHGQIEKRKEQESKGPYVIEVMTKDVLTREHNISVADTLNLFKVENIHHLILTHKNKIIGLVSDRDLLWVEKIHMEQHATAKQFMSKTILCCHEETPVHLIARVMLKEGISALPVIDEQQVLVGIITHHDLLRLLS